MQAVGAKPLTYVSASQIQMFIDCPRKWYLTYVLGMKQPATAAQILGTAIHTEAENYLKFQIEPDVSTKAGLIFSRGISLLPEPKQCVVEHGFETTIGGSPIPIKGFIDVYYQTDDEFVVLDHKTSSSKQWIKSEAELAINPQLITYAAYAFENLWDGDTVTVSHVYYGTKQNFSERVDVLLQREFVFQVWADLVLSIEKMLKCHSETENNVRQNLISSSNYGGCEFRSRCLAPQKENVNMTQSTLDLLLQKADANKSQPVKKTKQDVVLKASINPPEGDEEIIPITEPSVEEVETVLPSPDLTPKSAPLTKTQRWLFVKCFPSKDLRKTLGDVTNYADLIAPISKSICEQYDVPHISMVGQYGDGYKLLAAAVAKQGWSTDYPCIYINPIESKGSEHVMDVLIALADVVVKGM